MCRMVRVTSKRAEKPFASGTANNIFGNASHGLYNATSNIIDAESNWWGTSGNPASMISGPVDMIHGALMEAPVELSLYRLMITGTPRIFSPLENPFTVMHRPSLHRILPIPCMYSGALIPGLTELTCIRFPGHPDLKLVSPPTSRET